jgi:hypothetical protein
VGSGCGRFAAALGARYGADPTEAAVLLARQRGIRALVGRGELLPFADGTFGAVVRDEDSAAIAVAARTA